MYIPDDELRRYGEYVDTLVKQTELPGQALYTVEEVEAYATVPLGLGIENIVGFGVGEKIVGGIGQGVLAIQAHVIKKVPPSFVNRDVIIATLVQRYIDKSVLTDVLEVGRPQLFHHHARSYNPRVPGGVSVGNTTGRWGTLGAWLKRDGDTFLLSCWHTIAEGVAPSSKVLHPHTGTTIGTLSGGVDPRSCATGQVTVDAALAVVDPDVAEHFILRLGELRGVRKAQTTHYPVAKYGAVSHLTRGWVVSLVAFDRLAPDPQSSTPIPYKRQLLIQPDLSTGYFGLQGDSGAVVLDEDNYAIGLFVGGGLIGNNLSPAYYATPIGEVLAGLESTLNLAQLKFFEFP